VGQGQFLIITLHNFSLLLIEDSKDLSLEHEHSCCAWSWTWFLSKLYLFFENVS